MSREQGSHEQLSHKRAEEQAGEAVNGRSKGQIELRRITVEHRRGNLVTRASSILDDILGGNYRAQQIRAAFDLLIRCSQAALAVECGGESFCVRRLDGVPLSEKAPLILARRNAVEPRAEALRCAISTFGLTHSATWAPFGQISGGRRWIGT
jgi:hypothetical protein